MRPTPERRALGVALVAALLVNGQKDWTDDLVGTWTSKSWKVVTGSRFYDPVNDIFFEPELTGQSYSFSADGYYESALYLAISDAGQPNCPQAIMQWQHGKYEQTTKDHNVTLILRPIEVDGRQMLSSPCENQNSVYTRYHQIENITNATAYTDPFTNIKRLDLFGYNGEPKNPMWLAFNPPQMLPTQTLNPTASGTTAAKSTGTSKSKRSFNEHGQEILPWGMGKLARSERHLETIWWVVAFITVLSSILYLRA